MKRFVGFLLAVFSVFFLTSCGGGGGGAQPNPIVFTLTVPIDQSGGTIEDATRNIRLIVPPGAYEASGLTTLQVRQNQRPSAHPQGYTANANAIDITIDMTALTSDGTLTLEIPFSGPLDEIGTVMMLTNDSGAFFPLDVTFDSGRQALIGTVTRAALEFIGISQAQGGGQSSGAFMANGSATNPQVVGNFLVFVPQTNGRGTFRELNQNDTMTGNDVAIVVHGFANNGADMVDMARFLHHDGKYEAIWAYEYNYLAKIDLNGDHFAQELEAKRIGATSIDVYAHSMGGLVSRWAIEKAGVGSYVHRLVTLGTPHQGTPNGITQILGWLGGWGPGNKDVAEGSDFLHALNDNPSAWRTSAEYFTLAGSAWNEYGWIGLLSEAVYNGNSGTIVHDGLVQQSSAWGTSVLGDKSDSWDADLAARDIEFLAHDQLNGEPNGPNYDDTCALGDSSRQCTMVRAVRPWLPEGSGGISVSISPSFVNLEPSGAQQFTATVEGTANQNVTWTVDEPGGGTVTSDGLYTAPATVGTYHLRATSQADPSKSATADVLVQSAGEWTVINLHPTGAVSSAAYGVDGGQQVGVINHITEGSSGRASLWTGSAASWVDLNPTGATSSIAYGVHNGQQVGKVHLANVTRASLWSGSAASWVDLHPAGATVSIASGVHSGQQVGWVRSAGADRASLWSGSAASLVDLHPAGALSSYLTGIGDGQQVGHAHVGGTGQQKAGLWTGSAASYVQLGSSGIFVPNFAYGVGGGQQVGSDFRASLWSGSAASWVNLNPTGATDSTAAAVHGGQQVGAAVVGGVIRASLWSGSAASWVDLHAYLPSPFDRSWALGITHEGTFTYVVGYGWNSTTSRNEALMWVKSN